MFKADLEKKIGKPIKKKDISKKHQNLTGRLTQNVQKTLPNHLENIAKSSGKHCQNIKKTLLTHPENITKTHKAIKLRLGYVETSTL